MGEKSQFSFERWEKLEKTLKLDKKGVDPVDTRVQVLKFPFPEHMNPAGRTFGGQILSWMHESAYICGSKFAKQRMLTAASVDEVNFIAPSGVQDALIFKCQVNR